MKGFDQGATTLMGSWYNNILARHYETNGKPPNAQGWDIGVFESSSYNNIMSGSHSAGVDSTGVLATGHGGDIALFVDDRSSNSTL